MRWTMAIMMIDIPRRVIIVAVGGVVKKTRRRNVAVGLVIGTRIVEIEEEVEIERDGAEDLDIASKNAIGIVIATGIGSEIEIGVGETMLDPSRVVQEEAGEEEKGEGGTVDGISTDRTTSLPPLNHCRIIRSSSGPWFSAWHSLINVLDNGGLTPGKSIPLIVCPMGRVPSTTLMAVLPREHG